MGEARLGMKLVLVYCGGTGIGPGNGIVSAGGEGGGLSSIGIGTTVGVDTGMGLAIGTILFTAGVAGAGGAISISIALESTDCDRLVSFNSDTGDCRLELVGPEGVVMGVLSFSDNSDNSNFLDFFLFEFDFELESGEKAFLCSGEGEDAGEEGCDVESI